MDPRKYLPAGVTTDDALTAGAVTIGTLATVINFIAGDKTEAFAFLALTLYGAYRSGELNAASLQRRQAQFTSFFTTPNKTGRDELADQHARPKFD